MQLVAAGKIVRGDGRRVAIQTMQHEFRTVGIPSEHRNVLAGATHNPAMRTGATMFAAFGKH
jgi:hypothetical protein